MLCWLPEREERLLHGSDTMHSGCCVVALLVLIICVLPMNKGCEPGQTRQGCRIQQGQCLCGVGCYSEYRYSNKDECRKALKGRRYDVCQRNPCFHNGVCSQTSQEPGYKCLCGGTGYYGPRCQYPCPAPGTVIGGNQEVFPIECIIIWVNKHWCI